MLNKIDDGPLKKDEYDNKLLFYLSQNFRTSRDELAEKIGLSTEEVISRVERLKSEMIKPAVILNFPFLGIKGYILLLRGPSRPPLAESKNTYLFISLVGKFQYFAIVFSEDILLFCKTHLKSQDVHILPIDEFLPDDFNPYSIKINQIMPRLSPKKLDKSDYKILYELCNDPEMQLSNIAKKHGLTKKIVENKLNTLLHNTTIQKIRYQGSLAKYGFSLYVFKLRVKPLHMEKIISSVRNNKYSGFMYKSSNVIIFQYFPLDNRELDKFVKFLYYVDDTIDIDIMQNSGDFYVESVPKYVLEVLESRFT